MTQNKTMQRFASAREAALTLRPDQPVYCFRPQVLIDDAHQFMKMFPGETAYAQPPGETAPASPVVVVVPQRRDPMAHRFAI